VVDVLGIDGIVIPGGLLAIGALPPREPDLLFPLLLGEHSPVLGFNLGRPLILI